MKIQVEVDFEDLFFESGCENDTAKEEIKKSIINRAGLALKEMLAQEYATELREQRDKVVTELIRERLVPLFNDTLEEEIIEKDAWGKVISRGSIKNRIIKEVKENCSLTSSSKLREMISSMVNNQLYNFKKEFDALIKESFAKEALEYAIKSLKQKFGLQD